MIGILNIALLLEKAIDAANVGDVIYWMGKPLKIDITDDCRKIAYPLVREQTTQAAWPRKPRVAKGNTLATRFLLVPKRSCMNTKMSYN